MINTNYEFESNDSVLSLDYYNLMNHNPKIKIEPMKPTPPIFFKIRQIHSRLDYIAVSAINDYRSLGELISLLFSFDKYIKMYWDNQTKAENMGIIIKLKEALQKASNIIRRIN